MMCNAWAHFKRVVKISCDLTQNSINPFKNLAQVHRLSDSCGEEKKDHTRAEMEQDKATGLANTLFVLVPVPLYWHCQ